MATLEDAGVERVRYTRFEPTWQVLNEVGSFPEEVIAQEPMLFGATVNFAKSSGGPITRAFLDKLNIPADSGIIDSRVHMLKRGWYPCIPGWHIDDFYRGENGQPDLKNAPGQRHYFAIFGDVSKTEFLSGTVDLPDAYPGENLYACYNREVNTLIARKDVSVSKVRPGFIYSFGNSDLHRGTAATGDGWRFFIRVSVGSCRIATNTIRKQVQVYLPALEAGW